MATYDTTWFAARDLRERRLQMVAARRASRYSGPGDHAEQVTAAAEDRAWYYECLEARAEAELWKSASEAELLELRGFHMIDRNAAFVDEEDSVSNAELRDINDMPPVRRRN